MKKSLYILFAYAIIAVWASLSYAQERPKWSAWQKVIDDPAIEISFLTEDPINGQPMMAWRVRNTSNDTHVIQINVGVAKRKFTLTPKMTQSPQAGAGQVIGAASPPQARVVMKKIIPSTSEPSQPKLPVAEKSTDPVSSTETSSSNARIPTDDCSDDPACKSRLKNRNRTNSSMGQNGTDVSSTKQTTDEPVPCALGWEFPINRCVCPIGTETSFGETTRMCFQPSSSSFSIHYAWSDSSPFPTCEETAEGLKRLAEMPAQSPFINQSTIENRSTINTSSAELLEIEIGPAVLEDETRQPIRKTATRRIINCLKMHCNR
ncbi:MAG: hypothetical protein WC477_05400 [Patescibacteria group bacterium]